MTNPQLNDRDASDTRLTPRLLAIGGVIVLGATMAILDATIVNVAVPTLGRRFGASIGSIQWVMTAYLLAFATVIPLSGGSAAASAPGACGLRRWRSSWPARSSRACRGRWRRSCSSAPSRARAAG